MATGSSASPAREFIRPCLLVLKHHNIFNPVAYIRTGSIGVEIDSELELAIHCTCRHSPVRDDRVSNLVDGYQPTTPSTGGWREIGVNIGTDRGG